MLKGGGNVSTARRWAADPLPTMAVVAVLTAAALGSTLAASSATPLVLVLLAV
ncbi:MAG: hypothetical protein H0U62_06570, partial [Actinobacteria bacterium]|nr:hypothetical protein [Actinomycetota bacterium]